MTKTLLTIFFLVSFLITAIIGPVPSYAQDYHLPAPGVMVHLSPPFDPPILKGIKVHPDNPFRFDFIMYQGDSAISSEEQLKIEAIRLIKYFLASLTVPEKDLWVNLSPYEKDRIIPNSFGLTEMGRDLLAEDYMLKQITASLIYPEDKIGKKFWKRIYEVAARKYGTTNIPVNTFNKVWIVPEKAVVYENAKAGTAYVVESKLKVMLEQDYLSLEKHEGILSGHVQAKDTNKLGNQIVREILIPELTKEINENKNFIQLRQVYNSLILAIWYKKKIKDSILIQVYADKNKVAGVRYASTAIPSRTGIRFKNDVEGLYQVYLRAFKKGVYNYIKDEQDPITQEIVPRKYFSGGMGMEGIGSDVIIEESKIPDETETHREMLVKTNIDEVSEGTEDTAMLNSVSEVMGAVPEELKMQPWYKEALERAEEARRNRQNKILKSGEVSDSVIVERTLLQIKEFLSKRRRIIEIIVSSTHTNNVEKELALIKEFSSYIIYGDIKNIIGRLIKEKIIPSNYYEKQYRSFLKQQLSESGQNNILDNKELQERFMVLTDGYLLEILNLVSLRIWDNPDQYLKQIQEILDEMNDPVKGSTWCFIKRATSLPVFESSYFIDGPTGYVNWIDNFLLLDAENQIRMVIFHARVVASHLALIHSSFQLNSDEIFKTNSIDYYMLLYEMRLLLHWYMYFKEHATRENIDIRREILDTLAVILFSDRNAFLSSILEGKSDLYDLIHEYSSEIDSENLENLIDDCRNLLRNQAGFMKDHLDLMLSQFTDYSPFAQFYIFPYVLLNTVLNYAVITSGKIKHYLIEGRVMEEHFSIEGLFEHTRDNEIAGRRAAEFSIFKNESRNEIGFFDGWRQAEISIREMIKEFDKYIRQRDQAQLTKTDYGGIDLTPAHMNLQTQNNGVGIKFQPDAAMLQQFRNTPGFTVRNIIIQPLKSLPEFLEMNQDSTYP